MTFRFDPALRLATAVLIAVSTGCGSTSSPPYVPPRPAAPALPEPSLKTLRLDGSAGGVVARVNGRAITDWELAQRLPPPFRDRARWDDPEVNKVVLRTLRNLAEHRILIDAARDHQIAVPDAEVDEQIREERTKAKLTPEAYRRQVELQTGRPFARYRDDIKEVLLIQKLLGRSVSIIYITPHKVRRQFQENPDTFAEEGMVSYQPLIIASARAGGEASAKSLADAIHRQLAVGGNFDVLCRTYRAYAPDAHQAGLVVRNVTRERLPTAAERVLFDPGFPVGAHTSVLPFETNWAILKLVDRRERRMKRFEDFNLQRGIIRTLSNEVFIARRKEILSRFTRRASFEPPDLFPPGYPDVR
jgi:hypothetical protein